jgi:hypothetical protein
MRRFSLFLATSLAIFAVSSPAFAQRILPASFAGYAGSAQTALAPAAIGTWADVEAAQEYGFTSGEAADFTRAGVSLHVRLYRMKDPSGAYGLYSYFRTPDMPHADISAHSAISNQRALALSGNFVLDIRGTDLTKLSADLKALVGSVAPHAEEGPLPVLPERLPLDNMVERSDHYVLGPQTLNQFFPLASGDWLGFSDGAEVEVAKYRLRDKEATLLIADFPTPQAAKKKLAELKLEYNLSVSGDSSSSSVATRRGAALFAKRSVTLIAIVSGADSQAEADLLLKPMHSGTDLTWNEPNFEATEPDIGTMIVGTIIGTGIICLFALISGLAFGGVRLIVKRLLPDKVFDRSNHLQVLQLGLSSKPIKSEDFYGLEGRSRE